MFRTCILLLAYSSLAGVQNASPSPNPSSGLSGEVRKFVKFDAPIIAPTHVRVINGTGARAREDQTVILSKGEIDSAGDASSANLPNDAQVLDLKGYTVIPGFVGMHDHMFYPVGPGSFESARGAVGNR